MGYADENNAGFLTTLFKFGSSSKGGPLGVTNQRIVAKDPINAGGNITPVARPAKLLDARVVARVLDMTSQDAINATPANCETDVQEANGTGSGTVIRGPMTPGNVDDTNDHANGPHYAELEYLMLGSALTETTTL